MKEDAIFCTFASQDLSCGVFFGTAGFEFYQKGTTFMSEQAVRKQPSPKKLLSGGRIRKLTVTALLGAVSAVLMLIQFSVPLIPSFIKMDVSNFPALIASFAFGPTSGMCVALIKNLLNLLTTSTGGIGELSDFILSCILVIPAGLIYKHRKNRNFAFLGAFVGTVCMAGMSLLTNYYITYPIYTTFMPMDMILSMYQDILPSANTLWKALLIFNVPFTFVKGMLCTAVTFILYKPLSPLIKGKAKI